MRLTKKLYNHVVASYPGYAFAEGNEFRWSPSSQTIVVRFDDEHGTERLLHELAHAELNHTSYEHDISLIALERDAWQYARENLALGLSVTITDNVIEDDLDTYREWMHARSTCPECGASGIQVDTLRYQCPSCATLWRVNAARGCELRRYKQ